MIYGFEPRASRFTALHHTLYATTFPLKSGDYTFILTSIEHFPAKIYYIELELKSGDPAADWIRTGRQFKNNVKCVSFVIFLASSKPYSQLEFLGWH